MVEVFTLWQRFCMWFCNRFAGWYLERQKLQAGTEAWGRAWARHATLMVEHASGGFPWPDGHVLHFETRSWGLSSDSNGWFLHHEGVIVARVAGREHGLALLDMVTNDEPIVCCDVPAQAVAAMEAGR